MTKIEDYKRHMAELKKDISKLKSEIKELDAIDSYLNEKRRWKDEENEKVNKKTG